MKIKWKLTLYSTLWLSLILIIFNILVYYFFLRVSTESEVALLYNKADIILSTDASKVFQSEDQLLENLVNNEIIRVLDHEGNIQQQVSTDWELAEIGPVPVLIRESELIHSDGGRILFVRVPIFEYGSNVGTLEIGRTLKTMDAYVNNLNSIQWTSTLLSIAFSLIGGYLFAQLALYPITEIIRTIKDIHGLGLSRRIEITSDSKDEIYELSITFNEMLDRIESTFAQQQRFLADVSHELRTPLTVIESYANLLKRWGSKDPEIQEEAIREIQSEAERLRHLTESLLDISSIEREEVKLAPLELVSFLKKSIKPFRHVYQRNIRLQVDKRQIFYPISEQRLKQLLVIFLDNAIKYSAKEVLVWLEEDQDFVEIGVKDKGIGIPEEDLPFVSERFYRVDKVRNRSTGGKGLGLSIANSIVSRYGGEMEVKSSPGQGTEVLVRFPKSK